MSAPISLRPEQRDLLCLLVEAEKATGEREFIFIFVDQLPGGLLYHPGIQQPPSGSTDPPVTALLDDVLELQQNDLVRYSPGRRPPNGTITVTQLGIEHHDFLHAENG